VIVKYQSIQYPEEDQKIQIQKKPPVLTKPGLKSNVAHSFYRPVKETRPLPKVAAYFFAGTIEGITAAPIRINIKDRFLHFLLLSESAQCAWWL